MNSRWVSNMSTRMEGTPVLCTKRCPKGILSYRLPWSSFWLIMQQIIIQGKNISKEFGHIGSLAKSIFSLQCFQSWMFEPSKRLENGIGDQWIISLIWSLGFTHGKFCRHCQVRRETILRNLHSRCQSGRSADQYLGLLLVLLLDFELLDSSNGKVLFKNFD